MTTTHTIHAQPRTTIGRKVSRLRNEGMIPAVVYGKGKENVAIAVERNAFHRVFRQTGENTLIALTVEGETKPRNVLAYTVAIHPVTDETQHIDFYEVDMHQKVTTEVPLIFIGEAPAVTLLGGTLATNKAEVEIQALPADLPHEINVDISTLATFDDVIHARNIVLPKDVELMTDPEETIAYIEAPRSEEELAELDKAVEENVETVGAVEEEKKDEGEGDEQNITTPEEEKKV